MKKLLKFTFALGIVSVFSLASCRTGDDGTENHGSAADRLKHRNDTMTTEQISNPSDATSTEGNGNTMTVDSTNKH